MSTCAERVDQGLHRRGWQSGEGFGNRMPFSFGNIIEDDYQLLAGKGQRCRACRLRCSTTASKVETCVAQPAFRLRSTEFP